MSHQSALIAEDIEAYLKAHEHKSLLRFLTCGSVDDGKSTLIGRLLYDSKMIFEDQMAALEADSKKVGTQGGEIDFALLVDGLAAEREQGITIDVAYRFFSTDTRKFIVADTPGHEQYTRNMVTGASTADAAIILIDARKGVLTQTRRHSFILSLIGVKHVVLAVNKMDLVGWSRETFDEIVASYHDFAAKIGIKAFTAYLGEDRESWKQYDTVALIQSGHQPPPLLVDQGESDEFLEPQLKPQLLQEACLAAGYKMEFNLRPGYDHSYYFIASFIGDHIKFHAQTICHAHNVSLPNMLTTRIV